MTHDQQERRVDGLAKNVDQVAQEVHVKGAIPKAGQRQPQTTKSLHRSSLTAPAEAAAQESVPAAHQEPELNNHAVERTVVPVAAEESPEPVAVATIRPSNGLTGPNTSGSSPTSKKAIWTDPATDSRPSWRNIRTRILHPTPAIGLGNPITVKRTINRPSTRMIEWRSTIRRAKRCRPRF